MTHLVRWFASSICHSYVTLAEGIGEGIGDAETMAFKTLMFGNHFFIGGAYPWLTRTRHRGLKGESHVFYFDFFCGVSKRRKQEEIDALRCQCCASNLGSSLYGLYPTIQVFFVSQHLLKAIQNVDTPYISHMDLLAWLKLDTTLQTLI